MSRQFVDFLQDFALVKETLGVESSDPAPLIRDTFALPYTEQHGNTGLDSPAGTVRMDTAVEEFRRGVAVPEFVARYCQIQQERTAP